MRVRISSVPVLFYFWRCCVISNREHQINEEIRDKELRVIDVDGNQLGILSADEALKIAFEKDLDLVKIAPQATPPVCRIMDYGKFCFEQTKRAKEAKKNQKVIEIKEVRMSSTIDTQKDHKRKRILRGAAYADDTNIKNVKALIPYK